MTATVAQLAARALRKVGLAPVAVGDRPATGTTIEVTAIADQALFLLGVGPIATTDRPSVGSSVALIHIAARTLQLLGANPIDQSQMPALSGSHDTTDVAQAALLRLNVYAAGETAEAEDQSYGEAVATSVLEELIAINAATWAYNTIPEWALQHMVTMTCHYLRPAFGLPPDPDGYAAARDAIVAAALSGTNAQTRAEDEVSAAHQALNALGLVTWTEDEIPMSCSSHYAVMAAAKLAPAYGKPGDQAAYDAAVAQIRAFALSSSNAQQLAVVQVYTAHQVLNGLGYVTWTADEIPEKAAPHYALMAAQRLAPAWGKATDESAYQGAINLMRVLAMSGATGQAIAEEKVRAAHRSLDARGLTQWAGLMDLPLWAEEPLVMIAAEMLAPEVGQPPMPGLARAGEMELRRALMMPSAGRAIAREYF